MAPALPPPIQTRRGAIVLVHGAWVGEWSWTPLLPHLEGHGRSVHAVSLTGHGARSHQSGPHVTRADHVADVVGTILTLDLEKVVLVGHSYGGRVITAVHEQVADRIAHMVYLDAHAPLAPDAGQSPARAAEAAASGGMLAFSGYDPDPAEVGGEEGLRWFLDRVMPQSYATFSEPLGDPLPADVRKTYVFATGYEPTRFSAYAAGASADPTWGYHEIETSHWLMFTHPAEIADLILG